MAHIHEKLDFTASVYIVYSGKVLLRKHEKYGLWMGPGGHIELNEDPNEAVVREAKEEVGLDIVLWDGVQRFKPKQKGRHKELIPPIGLNRHPISDTHEHVDLVYLATSDSDGVVPENVDDEWRWCTKEDLEKMELEPDIRLYARFALDTLAG